MCLVECPTYRLRFDENESPRGRLAIMGMLLDGTIERHSPAIAHLDSCLGCRRCERVCPSGVEYGALLDAVRARSPTPPGRRLVARLLQRASLQLAGCTLARLVPPTVTRPFGRLHTLHRLGRALTPDGPAPAARVHPGNAPVRGRVGLFAGCSAAALQPGALQAATKLLCHAGFDVFVPKDKHCCGALTAHAGDRQGATKAARRTRAAFAAGLDAIVSLASGCGIHLDTYDPPLPHVDICRFLADQGRMRAAVFTPLRETVALHVPCSVENVYRGSEWARTLLRLVPGLEVGTVGSPGQCCGAAGDYMLRHSVTAARLRQAVLDDIIETGFELVATSNAGCAAHLALGLADRGASVRIVHPVEILARQLVRIPESAAD
jgi:glycolate oxidase iron-sulfur subunit